MVTERVALKFDDPHASTLWLTGLTLGLATGFGDVAYHVLYTQIHTSDGLGVHMLWMTPISNLLWFLTATAVLVVLRRRLSYAAAVGILLGLATLSLLLRYPRLYILAVLIVALGVAVQGTRLLRGHEARAARWLSRAAVPLVLAVAILGMSVAFQERRAERRALAALPAPASDVNVLLLVLDTVRAMDLSLYGFDRPTTPALERWASDGAVFDWAFSTAPWTLPSHASLFTGKPAHELRANWARPLDDGATTLAEVLRDRGYLTAGFVANLLYLDRDRRVDRAFNHYEDHPVSPGELLGSSALGLKLHAIRPLRKILGNHQMPGRKSAAEVNQDFLTWLYGQSGNIPFFAFINYYDAHQPYLPPPDWDQRFATSSQPRTHDYDYQLHEVGYRRDRQFTAQEFQREREAYQAAIAHLDDELDRLFAELERRQLLDRTIVIVTSDHGEHFGEYGEHGHGNTLYTQVTRVPLLMRYPAAIPRGTRVAAPVTLADVPATILELTRLAGTSSLPGASLSRYWGEHPAADTTPVLTNVRPPNNRDFFRGLVVGSHHLVVQTGAGDGGLFDLSRDPLEEKSVAADTAYAAILHRLQAMLDSLMPLPPSAPKRPSV